MGEGPIDTAGNRHLAGRYCITRIPLALGLAGGALWLTFQPDQTVLPLVLWLFIVLWAVLAIWNVANTAPDWGRRPGFCGWSALLGVSVAAGALFAAGYTAMASVSLSFLLFGLALAFSGPRAARGRDGADDEWNAPSSWAIAIQFAFMASSLWLGFGLPPEWAADMITGVLWTLSVLFITVGLVGSLVFALQPWFDKVGNAAAGRTAQKRKLETLPDRERTTGEWLAIWAWRVIALVTSYGLWAAGHDWLMGCFLLAILMQIALSTDAKRRKHGEHARIDFFARAVRIIVWWPVVAVGAIIAAAAFTPFIVVGLVIDWLSGRRKAKGWEREERVRKARIKRAAASYRLREAFGKTDGLIYFLYSEPHQREHFLGQGALLAGMEGRAVARDWRVQVMPARSKVGWTKYQQTPEGALLHVNEIGNMQKDLPFVVIVPPRGRVQIFKISEAYRARKRDKGAGLAEAEAEIRAAMETAFGPPAE